MLDVAILGFGTVGSGVMEVIDTNAERIAQNAAQEIKVKYILDVRQFPGSPYEKLFIKDFDTIENDPDVIIVVETIGGTGVAYDFTKRALLAGKNVVTSNKELVATHGHELIEIARKNNVNYLFEASVGGGIPILRPITQCLAANQINEIYGILNGTTNYILTKMIMEGMSFDAALAQAQENGYAERDPSADIEGLDACRKICILSALCFKRHVYPEFVPTKGITDVTLADVKNAASIDHSIKLLGRSVLMDDGKIAAYVAPHLVSKRNLVASVEGVMNGIVVRGNAIGDVMFYGAGAGKLPTASAVVADVIDASKHTHARKYVDWDDGGAEYTADHTQIPTRWYIRCDDSVLRASTVFPASEFINGDPDGKTAFITNYMTESEVEKLSHKVKLVSLIRVFD